MYRFVTHKAGLIGVGICLFIALAISAGAFFVHPNFSFYQSHKIGRMVNGIPVPTKKPVMVVAAAKEIEALPKAKEKTVRISNEPNSFEIAMASSFRHNALNTRPIAFSKKDKKQAHSAAEIFDLQSHGELAKANAKMLQLKNRDLRGHILAQRYLENDDYKSSYQELYNWMVEYNDLPQASKIYELAMRKKSAGDKTMAQPKAKRHIIGNLETLDFSGKIYASKKTRNSTQNQAYLNLKHAVRLNVQHNEPTQALNKINANGSLALMDDVEYDRLRADIAAGYLYSGRINHAYRLSRESLERSGAKVPQAAWVKGLVLWQKENYKDAAKAFEVAASSDYSTGWTKSAAAYWASRSYARAKNKRAMKRSIKQAAEYPRTFYGVIANYALGNDDVYNWSVPYYNKAQEKTLASYPAGRRAIMLIQAGREDLAQQELQYAAIKNDKEYREAVIAFANHYNLSDLSLRLANAFRPDEDNLYDAALYPDTPWAPFSGYKVDKALINAVIRQESRFKVRAKNASGATGLMQVMPDTARYILTKTDDVNDSAMDYLHKPEVNMEFGQTYLKYLLNHKVVGNDLFSMAMAYNAGPGNLSKWKREREDMSDPLMFIETIPFNETRGFVDRVMANYWIYRMRYGQDVPSLEAVAEGQWPRYMAQDDSGVELAMR